MIEVALEYKRIDMQSTGRIVVRDEGKEEIFFSFDQLDFEPMLYKFAEALQANPSAAGVIQRTDRPGLIPYVLDERTVDLFRTDPITATKSMSTPYGSPSTTAKRIREESAPVASGLRIGHSTLADAFGDELYCRYDKQRERIECPCCGIWARLLLRDVDARYYISCKNPSCAPHGKPLFLKSKNGKWASFSTFDLLATHSDRFYFPRTWNEGKVWITWEGLNNKYKQFEKEKKSCL